MTTPRQLAVVLCLSFVAGACSGPASSAPAPSASPTSVTSAAPTVTPSSPSGPTASAAPERAVTLREFPVPRGSRPHDVAPAADGGIWYTAQGSGELGWLDPTTGQTRHVKLGSGSAPHGVIVGADGAPWITDSGLNAIVRVDPRTSEVKRFDLPPPRVDLNTAVFDKSGTLWFTGQGGYFGRVDPDGKVHVFEAPRGRGPYGITATPDGEVFYASLAGDHIARVVKQIGGSQVIEPPTKDNGSRRVWSDSKGVIWVSEWDAGQLGRYDPKSAPWKEWRLPGQRPQPYSVFVDDRDMVWLSDFTANALVRFDPATEKFDSFPHAASGNIRQIHGRPGEVWGALSGLDKLLLATTR